MKFIKTLVILKLFLTQAVKQSFIFTVKYLGLLDALYYFTFFRFIYTKVGPVHFVYIFH